MFSDSKILQDTIEIAKEYARSGANGMTIDSFLETAHRKLKEINEAKINKNA